MKAFGQAFSPEARKAAHRLFTDGKVRILTQDDAFLSTSVRDGDSSERVLIRHRLDRLQVSCTCPRGGGGACAHVLASMLAAKDSGFGPPRAALQAGQRLQLRARTEGDLALDETSEEASEDPSDEVETGGDTADGPSVGVGEAASTRAAASGSPRRSRRESAEEAGDDDAPSMDWRFRLASLKTTPARPATQGLAEAFPELVYVIDAAASRSAGALVVVIGHRERRRDGQWGRVKFARPFRGLLTEATHPADREILHLLSGADRDADLASAFRLHDAHRVAARYRIAPEVQAFFAQKLASTERFFLRRPPDRVENEESETVALSYAVGPAFRLALALSRDAERYSLTGSLTRGEETLGLAGLDLVTTGGLAFVGSGPAAGRVVTFDPPEHAPWIDDFAHRGPLLAPRRHEDRLLRELAELPPGVELAVPDGLGIERVSVAPNVYVRLRSLPKPGSTEPVPADLLFDYQGQLLESGSTRGGFLQAPVAGAPRRLLVRDPAAEAAARRATLEAGAIESGAPAHRTLSVPADLVREFVARVAARGFRILVRDRELRQMRRVQFRVSSGVDWFDLKGGLDFGSEVVPWPALLKTLQRGDTLVRLSDGTQGMIPDEVVSRYARLVRLSQTEGDPKDPEAGLRFGRSQVALLDAMLAGEADVEIDAAFEQARDRLRAFDAVKPATEPPSFHGELRPYQREGLGWMRFLHEFGFGGCLADDMGLGKTVQVLALLEGRRLARLAGEAVAPSLVVVPRSLVFNWKQEAAKFAPGLKVLDHTGPLRSHTSFDGFDVVLSTYGTLRSDVARWQQTTFDYAILDEAQAIKNPTTESARAARLIRARHRLALSGTPVENRVSELLSIFSFINPSLAAGSLALTELASEKATPQERELLARGLRPFVLRRRKEDVLQDLPAKFEDTLFVELGAEQRKMYEELKEHFRFRITALLESQGLAKSRIQVLEALLRLRQAACHPGLLDDARIDDQDAKLEALLPRLAEVAAEGHRSLVFSQFTSYLSILRRRLDALGIRYAYLDGKTRDRKTVVETFEKDETIPVFLVSLKAGGLGLNLTAADYVFILDPWWNPAAEMQAIARSHRIGQTRTVFAYRLVAKDTVEEKVIQLQQKKRELVETLLGVDKSEIASLKREDIELLLA